VSEEKSLYDAGQATLPVIQQLEKAGIQPTGELVDYVLHISRKMGDLQRELNQLKAKDDQERRVRQSSALSVAREAWVGGAMWMAYQMRDGKPAPDTNTVLEQSINYYGQDYAPFETSYAGANALGNPVQSRPVPAAGNGSGKAGVQGRGEQRGEQGSQG
jgi:hypothetical protein